MHRTAAHAYILWFRLCIRACTLSGMSDILIRPAFCLDNRALVVDEFLSSSILQVVLWLLSAINEPTTELVRFLSGGGGLFLSVRRMIRRVVVSLIPVLVTDSSAPVLIRLPAIWTSRNLRSMFIRIAVVISAAVIIWNVSECC